jgi:signal recognition particle receptor subunit beta
MNKQDLMNLSKGEVVEEYMKLENRFLKMLAENSVLEARLEQAEEMNNMLIEKESKKRILRKE